MEANKTITYVVLSDDQLTDEGKEASLLGMKEVNFDWVVLVGARFSGLASKLRVLESTSQTASPVHPLLEDADATTYF